jgi:hypothetical protein
LDLLAQQVNKVHKVLKDQEVQLDPLENSEMLVTVVLKDSKVVRDQVDQLVQQGQQDQLDLVDLKETKASKAYKGREDQLVNKEIVVFQDLLDPMDL